MAILFLLLTAVFLPNAKLILVVIRVSYRITVQKKKFDSLSFFFFFAFILLFSFEFKKKEN
jgi:hypothetical protein